MAMLPPTICGLHDSPRFALDQELPVPSLGLPEHFAELMEIIAGLLRQTPARLSNLPDDGISQHYSVS